MEAVFILLKTALLLHV